MASSAKTIAFWTCKFLLAVGAFLVSALLADTIPSYILPRIFAESPRRDIYNTPTLNIWFNIGKHAVTLAVSVWAGIFAWQFSLEPHRREGRPGADSSTEIEGRPFPSSWQERQWQNERGDRDGREEGGAESRNFFQSVSCPTSRSSTPASSTTIQDWLIYQKYFGEPPLYMSTPINNQSDGRSLSSADDASGSDAELNPLLNMIPKQFHAPDKLTPLTPSEASHYKARLVRQLSSCPQLSYDEAQLNKCIILDVSRQYIADSKAIEDEYQLLHHKLLSKSPTKCVRAFRIFAFREMVLFNTVKCWVSMDVHMLGVDSSLFNQIAEECNVGQI